MLRATEFVGNKVWLYEAVGVGILDAGSTPTSSTISAWARVRYLVLLTDDRSYVSWKSGAFDGAAQAFDRVYGTTADDRSGDLITNKVIANDNFHGFSAELPLAA